MYINFFLEEIVYLLMKRKRYITMEAEVQSSNFLFVNIYAPNKVQEQCQFFDKLNKTIEDLVVNDEHKIIIKRFDQKHS